MIRLCILDETEALFFQSALYGCLMNQPQNGADEYDRQYYPPFIFLEIVKHHFQEVSAQIPHDAVCNSPG